MDQKKSLVVVGSIGGPHGVKGWLKVNSYTEPPENILAYTPWLLRGREVVQELELLQGQPHGKGLIVQLDGIDDRDRADDLKGMEIVVSRSQLPEPETGHYYWTDLEGLRVEMNDGSLLGTVDQLIEAGAADVMVVAGSKRHLIPFVLNETVVSVDLAAGCIRVNWNAEKQKN